MSQNRANEIGATRRSEWVVAKLTSNQVFTSTTIADVTGMSFAVLTGKYYRFRFNVVCSSDTLTIGVGVGITFPTSTIWACHMRSGANAVGGGGFSNTKEENVDYLTSGVKVQLTGHNTANQQRMLFIEGIIVPSADGTVQLQAGLETGAANVTIYQGTMMEVSLY